MRSIRENTSNYIDSNQRQRFSRVLLWMLLLAVAVTISLQRISAQDAPKTAPQTSKGAQKPAGNGPQSAADPNTYEIGVADQLMVSVWKEPELSMSVVVRPDGMITLPLVNEVRVLGLKPVELQQLLMEKFKPYVSEPQVTVIVQQIRSRKVYLAGNVGKQGAVNLEGGETAMQVLAAAGLNPFAKADSIYILRKENGKQIRIPFQYKKALKGQSKDDVVLQPGDVIVVP